MSKSPTSISFGGEGSDDFGINQSDTPTTHVHSAFSSPTREVVDAFSSNALVAGGQSHIPPPVHPEYHAQYSVAYIFDLAGNTIEAVSHGEKA